MPSVRPTEARVRSVLTGMKQAGIKPAEVVVDADGSFRVTCAGEDLQEGKADRNIPRRFGETR